MKKSRWILPLMIAMLLTGCLGTQGNGTGTQSTNAGNVNLLPPAWTPTPISLPGSGVDLGTWQACPEAPPSKLELGITVIVREGIGHSIRLRRGPGISEAVVGTAHPNDVLKIVGGPNCMDQMVWWELQSMGTGERGWAAEGNDYGSWLVRFE